MLDLTEGEFDLDFTRGTSGDTAVQHQARALQAEVEIGMHTLGSTGYHVTITRRAAQRRMDDGPRTILIIDDDESVRMVLGHCLGEAGYATRLAGNRGQMLMALQTPPLPDLILLDVEMPDADGFDVLEKLRQSKVVSNIPVVMLTARCNRNDIMRGLTVGAAGYITKPAKLSVINEALRVLLG